MRQQIEANLHSCGEERGRKLTETDLLFYTRPCIRPHIMCHLIFTTSQSGGNDSIFIDMLKEVETLAKVTQLYESQDLKAICLLLTSVQVSTHPLE